MCLAESPIIGRWPFHLVEALSQHPESDKEASLRLAQFSEVQSSVNRGSMSMAIDFRAKSSEHACIPLPEAVFTAFSSLINLFN